MDTPHLEIQGPAGKSSLPLAGKPVTVGRHKDNVVVVADARASRFHCVISVAPDGWMLRDLDSANGTAVNGKVVKSAVLRVGDEVIVGGTRMTLVNTGGPVAEGDEGMKLMESLEPETLTLDDIVEVDAPEAELVPADAGDDGPIHMDTSSAAEAPLEDAEPVMERLAESLPNKPYAESDIAMANARGQIVHPAGQQRKGSREAVDLFRLLLLICARSRGTDVHLEPKDGSYQVRMRVDGVMVDIVRLPSPTGVRLAALVKVLSDIDIAERNGIQEGHFSTRVPQGKSTPGQQRRVDYRVSFAPSVFGQKMVIRVLDTSYAPLTTQALQLPDWMREEVDQAVRQEAGMVLTCGPTGSGKTTTLYALLRASDLKRRNVVTIEDPVEIQIADITQIPVDESQGNTFSSLLRSLLRQDPDVILVGEVRDGETARIAMQAAITGHLVFSTIHTRDTIGTVFRLLDLGVEAYMISQGLHLVVAQRLVRQLCRFCKKAVSPTYDQLSRMGPEGQNVDRIFEPRGCPRCLGTGFAGRRAFFELLSANDALRDVIMTKPTPALLQDAMIGTPFVRLQQSGFKLVAEGAVAYDEIDRAVGRDTRQAT